MSTHALQTAAADEVEARDSASLDILVKALMAGLATILTARISAQAAVVAAVLATLAAEGVKQFVKRRNWGIKRVGFLVALTMLLGSIDSKVARGARKALGGSSHVLDVFAHGAGQLVLTTTAATAITVSAVTVPELATGRSILSDRDSTFFSQQKSDPLTIRGTQGTFDIGPGQVGRLLFDANAGERVFVQMTDSNIGATTLSLQRPDGVQVGLATYAYDFLDTQRLPANGTYSVVLDPFDQLSGRATVRVLRVPSDPVETVQLSEEAQPVTFDTAIGQNAEVHFQGEAGERVFVEITDSNIGMTTLSLRDPAGNELPGATYAYSFLDTQRLQATGRYSVLLDPSDNNHGRASVRVLRVPRDVVETVQLSEAAQLVTFNTAIGQNARLQFAGKAGERVFVEIKDSNIGTTTLSLRDAANEELPGATYAYSFLERQRLRATGTYSVVLDPWDHKHGRATVRITRD